MNGTIVGASIASAIGVCLVQGADSMFENFAKRLPCDVRTAVR